VLRLIPWGEALSCGLLLISLRDFRGIFDISPVGRWRASSPKNVIVPERHWTIPRGGGKMKRIATQNARRDERRALHAGAISARRRRWFVTL